MVEPLHTEKEKKKSVENFDKKQQQVMVLIYVS